MAKPIRINSDTAIADINIARLLEEPGGLEKIATEKLPPFIRETRDYEAFGRQILVAHTVGTEDLQIIDGDDYVYYPKDMNSHATYYGPDLEIPKYQIEGDGVNVAIGTISSDDVTINLKRLMTQRFNYLDRVRELSSQAVAKAEDSKIIDLTEKLLLGASADLKTPDHAGQIVTSADLELAKKHLVALKKTLSQHNVPLQSFVMNPSRLDDILAWASTEIDQLTMREIMETGVRYSIWGNVKLITSPIIDMNIVYSFSEPEYVGRMPILKDLTIMLTETENKLEKGLFGFEFLGIYMASQKAVGKLILDFTVGDAKIHPYNVDSIMARDTSEEVKGFGSREGK